MTAKIMSGRYYLQVKNWSVLQLQQMGGSWSTVLSTNILTNKSEYFRYNSWSETETQKWTAMLYNSLLNHVSGARLS